MAKASVNPSVIKKAAKNLVASVIAYADTLTVDAFATLRALVVTLAEDFTPIQFKALTAELNEEFNAQQEGEALKERLLEALLPACEDTLGAPQGRLVAIPLAVRTLSDIWLLELTPDMQSTVERLFRREGYIAADAKMTMVPRLLSPLECDYLHYADVIALKKTLQAKELFKASAILDSSNGKISKHLAQAPEVITSGGAFVSVAVLAAFVETNHAEIMPLYSRTEREFTSLTTGVDSETVARALDAIADKTAVSLDRASQELARSFNLPTCMLPSMPSGWFAGKSYALDLKRELLATLDLRAFEDEQGLDSCEGLCIASTFHGEVIDGAETLTVDICREAGTTRIGTLAWSVHKSETVQAAATTLLQFLKTKGFEILTSSPEEDAATD